jgi:hypothetical protein
VPKFVADSSVSPTGLKWAVDPVADVVTTAGDLIYGTAADTVARLGIGTASQVLAVNSGATAPEWVTPAAGGGKVLQVVNATYATTVNNATNVFADTGLTATITPSSATSKVLVIVNQTGLRRVTGNAESAVMVNLLRGATEIISEFAGLAGYTNSSLENRVATASISYQDSPNTTSATTYKTQFKNYQNANGVSVQASDSTSSITLMEIGA